jgi:hypothetical protein
MISAEFKLIAEKTRALIDEADRTIAYSEATIEQSKKLIDDINEKRLEREAGKINLK